MSIDEEVILTLQRQIRELRGQVEQLEYFRDQHMGTDAGQSGFNYPHPNQKVNVLEFGNGSLRLDKNGIQLISDNISSVSIYGLRTASLDPVNAAVQTRLTMFQTAGNALMAIGAYDFTNSRFASYTVFANSNGAYAATSSGCFQALCDGIQDVTISGGVITVSSSYYSVDTEAAAATDDLDTITATTRDSSLLLLRQSNNTHDVVVKHGTGNIHLKGSVDFTFTTQDNMLLLVKDAGYWKEIGRANT